MGFHSFTHLHWQSRYSYFSDPVSKTLTAGWTSDHMEFRYHALQSLFRHYTLIFRRSERGEGKITLDRGIEGGIATHASVVAIRNHADDAAVPLYKYIFGPPSPLKIILARRRSPGLPRCQVSPEWTGITVRICEYPRSQNPGNVKHASPTGAIWWQPAITSGRSVSSIFSRRGASSTRYRT